MLSALPSRFSTLRSPSTTPRRNSSNEETLALETNLSAALREIVRPIYVKKGILPAVAGGLQSADTLPGTTGEQ